MIKKDITVVVSISSSFFLDVCSIRDLKQYITHLNFINDFYIYICAQKISLYVW